MAIAETWSSTCCGFIKQRGKVSSVNQHQSVQPRAPCSDPCLHIWWVEIYWSSFWRWRQGWWKTWQLCHLGKSRRKWEGLTWRKKEIEGEYLHVYDSFIHSFIQWLFYWVFFVSGTLWSRYRDKKIIPAWTWAGNFAKEADFLMIKNNDKLWIINYASAA